jgi:predicted outer membrane repeat protein
MIKFDNNNTVLSYYLTNGGIMRRLLRLGTMLFALLLMAGTSYAQKPRVQVSGRIAPNDVRIFLKDSIYQINGTLMIAGTLLIEPGTEVVFLDNGRMIDSVGGRIIADGFMSATYNSTAPAAGDDFNDSPYYTGNSVVSIGTKSELSIADGKRNVIFNVRLNENASGNMTGVSNLGNTVDVAERGLVSGGRVISPERAIMFMASRLFENDDVVRFQPWKRRGGNTPNITQAPIVFRGQAVNDYSREWGHIIVLPGARAAYFRNVTFKDFRKDTTVDNRYLYDTLNLTGAAKTAHIDLNREILKMSNGAGGALTSFSARTWIVDCKFENNMARFRGGAVNLMQAPYGVGAYPDTTGLNLTFYQSDKNPNITNPDGSVIRENDSIIALDMLDTDGLPSSESTVSKNDARRQSVDDPRIAVYLGRVRRLTFDNNRTMVAYVDTVTIGGRQVLADNTTARVKVDSTNGIPTDWKNQAFGGAMYVGGRFNDEYRRLEIGLGVNDSIRINTSNPLNDKIRFGEKDFVKFTNNRVLNLQDKLSTRGARGGALYIGAFTSMIINGEFENNSAETAYLSPKNNADYALGGAIFHENTYGRLQIRGSSLQGTRFKNNRASSGGAIYVDGNTDPRPSPIIGGSDSPFPRIRDYGRRIDFEDNSAQAHGGAVYSKRNMTSYGAGGFINDLPLAQSYGPGFSINFLRNSAGFSGGAIAIHLPSIEPPVPAWQRVVKIVRTDFRNNRVGSIGINPTVEEKRFVRGGGAMYTLNADLNLVKGTLFENNAVINGSGGAIAMINPLTSSDRLFVSDADNFTIESDGTIKLESFVSNDSIFDNKKVSAVPADVRMLTRFINNSADINPDERLMGSGTSQIGANFIDVKRYHPGYVTNPSPSGLRENGVGLGGAIYILDSVVKDRFFRKDSLYFNRVRIQNNQAFTGAAVYSDNYALALVFQRSLITGNVAHSKIGRAQDVIGGPMISGNNVASSDLAGAVLYGEIVGPIPFASYHTAGNAIHHNDARFLIRLPDAPNTKGTLAGGYGTGSGGVDTLRGNYWGRTEANVSTILPTAQPGFTSGGIQETFFVRGNGQTHLRFLNKATYTDLREQGPFDYNATNSQGRPGLDYSYRPILIGQVPDTLLMAGMVYDMFDKGTDIKTADYSVRRLAPIEDFAVGIPSNLRTYPAGPSQSAGKVVRRLLRDPFATDSVNYATGTENLLWKQLRRLQGEFAVDHRAGEFTHPVGYPLFLEAKAAYNGADINTNNDDPLVLNESVFFVINDSTGDYVRVNMTQMTDVATTDNDGVYPREYLRGRVDFVADSAERTGTTSRVRRFYEGLANYGGTNSLLPFIADNAVSEDSAALGSRRWEMQLDDDRTHNYGSEKVTYINRATLPASIPNGAVTYYAGENYNSLPVRPGDHIRVVSRSVLWREGVNEAINKGISFRINGSVPGPVWTGSAVSVANPNVNPLFFTSFKDKVFVNEDISYNRASTAGQKIGRDTIFVITAIDSNKMYDPRWAMNLSNADGNVFTQLEYTWMPLFLNGNGTFTADTAATKLTGIRRWLRADTVWSNERTTSHPYYGATGRIALFGKPSNPYVIPGGEHVEVTAQNWAPNYRGTDAIRALNLTDAQKNTLMGTSITDAAELELAFTKNVVSKFIYLYPSYYHAQSYDGVNARFANQDTVDFGNAAKITYRFSIHVIDSQPVFQNTLQTSANCAAAGANQNFFVANVTDKLRFFVDFETDDEKEDLDAATNEGWDFRYGRTSYSFESKAIRSDDQVTDELSQTRPSWMGDSYLHKNSSDTDVDANGFDFTTFGQLNVRIPRAQALTMMTPKETVARVNGALNTDTMLTIVVNDGHSGVTHMTKRVFINVSPEIRTTSLPMAKEDVDYNPALLDFAKRIDYFDPNFGQEQSFELIYTDESRNDVPKDPCFAEAGNWDLTNVKTTPKWLKINPKSGLLYGTPGVKDAPRKGANAEKVTVLITDAGGLTDLRVIDLEVEETNHDPRAIMSPAIRCIANGQAYEDTITVGDIDLLREIPADAKESVTISIDPPVGNLTVEPSVINGTAADTASAMNNKVIIKSNGPLDIPSSLITDGKVTIRIKADDGDAQTFYTFKVNVSDVTDFITTIRVQNNAGAYQDLQFGTARNATTGEKEPDAGKLDANYCEFELPPFPPTDVFDARWTIIKTNGMHRNVFPTAIKGDSSRTMYKARFQSGAELGNTSPATPVTLTWKMSTVPTRTDATRNPSGGSWRIMDGGSFNYFQYDMATGTGKRSALIDAEATGDDFKITIKPDFINSFVILYDHASNVNEDQPTSVMGQTLVSEANPNPANESVNFAVTSSRENVSVQVYDLLGNMVNSFSSDLGLGTSNISWNTKDSNGTPVAPGMYTVKLTVGNDIVIRNVVVAR